VGLKQLTLQDKNDAPLLTLPAFDLVVDDIEVFSQKAALKSIKVESPELHVTRNRDGSLNLASLIAQSKTEKAPQPKTDEKPFGYQVGEIAVDQGKVIFADRGPERPFEKQLENIHIDVKGLANESGKKATTEISFRTNAEEEFKHSGALQLTPLLAEGNIELKSLQLKGLRPYYESVLGVEIAEGLLDLATRFAIVKDGDKPLQTKLDDLSAGLRSLQLNVPNERQPLWRSPLLAIKDTTVDVEKKSIVIGSIEGHDGNGLIQRNPDGSINFARIIKTQAGPSEAKKPDQGETAEWAIQMKHAALDGFRIVFEDRMLASPARMTISALSARIENASNAKNSRAKATIQAAINNKGRIRLAGTLGTRPVAGRFNLVTQGIEVGHVFKLGTKYSKAMGATFLDDKGAEIPLIMGCYGIGVNRIVAAAVEAGHDDNGILWPLPLAPYEALIIPLQPQNEGVMQVAVTAAHEAGLARRTPRWESRRSSSTTNGPGSTSAAAR